MRTVLHIRAGGAMLGAERVVLDLSHHSPQFGYRSIVAMPWDRGTDEPELLGSARAQGIETVPLPCVTAFSLEPIRSLRRFLRSTPVDVVHTHGYREDVYGAMCRGERPVVATNHLWKRTTPRLRLYSAVDARILKGFDHVVAVSEPILEEMRALGITRSSKVPNGLRLDRFAPRPSGNDRAALRNRLGIPPEATIVTMVSSLTPEKGHALALDAMSRLAEAHPEARLMVVGSGPQSEELRAQSASLGLTQHVSFLGRRSDIPEILSVTDVWLMTSLAEGLPIALLEAMAAGCAVVATAVGEVPSVITHGVDGLLADLDPEAIADHLAPLLRDADIRGRLGSSAAVTARRLYSADRMTQSYCAIYDRLLTAARV